MSKNRETEKKPTRGRPKTLDRDTVLEIALAGYWADGPTNLAIGEICQRAGVSKPGLYREFGSDDGLKATALELYRQRALVPLWDILARDESYEAVVEAFISFIAQDRQALGIPDGCLQIAMRACRGELGAEAGAKVDAIREQMLDRYEDFIRRAKARGDVRPDIPTDVAALCFDVQNAGAMRMQKEGIPADLIQNVLRYGLLSLSSSPIFPSFSGPA
ncbi:TetR/AcrR family transcriptional regulator [Coralliovum pocilloporae]|uniref:TetR/AcrR family transcriptional regulator n=1 Tax=Coralliovum pocilloporae TaxID=3066369 RepID=UPI00330750DC